MHYDPFVMGALMVSRNKRHSRVQIRQLRKPIVDLPDKRAKVKVARKQAQRNQRHRRHKS